MSTGLRKSSESARRWPSLLNTEAMESERVSVLALQEFIYFSHVVVVGAQHLLALRSPPSRRTGRFAPLRRESKVTLHLHSVVFQ